MIAKAREEQPAVFLIDDDAAIRDGIGNLLRSVGFRVDGFNSTKEFLSAKRPDVPSCLLLDVRLPGMSGLEFQASLDALGIKIPIVFMTGHADVPMGVQAMKAGAVEFFCKPPREQDLLDAVRKAVERSSNQRSRDAVLSKMQASFNSLTDREREVMALVATGLMNKQIAAKLGITQITVKVHRANVMRKMGARSLAELVRLWDALHEQGASRLQSQQAL